ncbi:MAG: hypothetical protein ACKOU6_16145 [Planctomycetota bacterium]
MSNPPESTADPSRQLPRPQFTLRTLFLIITLVCLLLAACQVLSPLAIGVLILVLLSVLAHVAGNAIGTQLRDGQSGSPTAGAQDQLSGSRVDGGLPDSHARRPLAADDFARRSQLSHRQSLRWLIILPSIVVGATIGGLLGAWWLSNIPAVQLSLLKLVVGTTATTVLGGMLGFLLSAFLKTLISANQDAWRH